MDKKKLFKDVVKGDTIKVWVDSDFFGNPIYQELTATTDAIDLTNKNILSGYGIYYGQEGLMFISAGDKEVIILEEAHNV